MLVTLGCDIVTLNVIGIAVLGDDVTDVKYAGVFSNTKIPELRSGHNHTACSAVQRRNPFQVSAELLTKDRGAKRRPEYDFMYLR